MKPPFSRAVLQTPAITRHRQDTKNGSNERNARLARKISLNICLSAWLSIIIGSLLLSSAISSCARIDHRSAADSTRTGYLVSLSRYSNNISSGELIQTVRKAAGSWQPVMGMSHDSMSWDLFVVSLP